jgi:hypothetical protein
MNEIRFRFVVVLFVWLAAAVTSGAILAESLYITDRISIDVYSEKSV